MTIVRFPIRFSKLGAIKAEDFEGQPVVLNGISVGRVIGASEHAYPEGIIGVEPFSLLVTVSLYNEVKLQHDA